MKKIKKQNSNKRKPYISKELEWVRQFFFSVGDLVPIENVTSIRGYTVPLDKSINTYAQITKYGSKYRITILTKGNDYLQNKQYDKYISMILEDLAHEMAHLVWFEESPRHFKLMGQIITRFGDVLDNLGIEEVDIKHTDFRRKDE